MQFKASKTEPPVGALITLEAVKASVKDKVNVKWDNQTAFDIGDDVTLTTNSSIARYLARSAPDMGLYGGDIQEKTEVDHWLTFSVGPLANQSEFGKAVSYLDSVVSDPATGHFLVGKKISAADYVVFGALNASGYWKGFVETKQAPAGLLKWYKSMENLSEVKKAVDSVPPEGKAKAKTIVKAEASGGKSPAKAGGKGGGQSAAKEAGGKEEGKFIDLPNAEMGKVVVRFPPEASGYLHVGHAKAALLNQHYQQHFKGKLIMRFDDTNPEKEKEEYENVILEDLKMLKVKYDHFSRSSDHFDTILMYCEKLLREGKAYVDDTDAETMKAEREARQESKRRNNSVEENMKLWDLMKRGTAEGQKCAVRAKMDMKSDNGCMRDPAIYRCKDEPHPATGDKYKVYPTYDFACPIVDSVEGVTHSLRTTEYMDRDEQFFWFIDALGLRKPDIWAYARLNLTNTVMSKRKLTWFVDEGVVDGWDDPRFPTVRGVLRRGLTVDALKQFILAQGSSRSVVFMEWDKIWAINKKTIDPVAPRFTAVDGSYSVPVKVAGSDVKVEAATVNKHPKDEAIGTKTVWRSATVVIDGADAETLKEGENATFINWGNLMIKKVNKNTATGKVTSVEAESNLQDQNFKKTLKITWLGQVEGKPEAEFTPTVCVYYDHIISKPVLDKDDDFKNYIGKDTQVEIEMQGDPELRTLKKGDIIQLQRRGFFIVDQAFRPTSVHTCKPTPIRLIAIPDGTPGSYGPPGRNTEKSVAEKKVDKKGKVQAKAAPKPAVAAPSGGNNAGDTLDKDITEQGNKVRQLKTDKADKATVTEAVNKLLELKGKYKEATGKDWKPGAHKPAAPAASPAPNQQSSGSDGDALDKQVTEQGNKVRQLKTDKADKATVDEAVKTLLDLKAKYKAATGSDWKPGAHKPASPAASAGGSSADDLDKQVTEQGNKVRQLKSDKADKAAVTEAVNLLLDLKAKYKAATGNDWKPGAHKPSAPAASNTSGGSSAGDDLDKQVTDQGNKVRQLKTDKADKATVTEAVNVLLDLKAKYKAATGNDWKPGAHKPSSGAASESPKKAGSPSKKSPSPAPEALSGPAAQLNQDIVAQGDKVRALKAEKADKVAVDTAVQVLLGLKAKFKTVTGSDWKPAGSSPQKPAKENKGGKGGGGGGDGGSGKKKDKKEQKKDGGGGAGGGAGGGDKKVTRLGMEARKADNLADWYSQIIVKAEMLEYYDVSGCYILRPWAFSIWEAIQRFFDDEIKKLGVENCYFPIFVSQGALQKEKDHIADFSPEVAWVTKSGDTKLSEPIAIRPTSETVMYPAYAKWIQSYRDLPLRLNQWNNVVRWEFKHPQPFLRTREFLWQEGHTAFATFNEAKEEVLVILDLYRQIYEDLLAIPVIRGKKTEKEKFAGGDYTTTTEAYIAAAGRAIQGATSHHLGQNFSKMFDITFEDPESGEKKFVYQNSWGITTRTLGVLVMVHGDDKGLVLPPKCACVQVVIVPCGITASLGEEDRAKLIEVCKDYESKLVKAGVKVRGDYRDNYSPGWKFNHWELKGVPIRLEVGPKDVKADGFVAVRRDTGDKIKMSRATAADEITKLLTTIQSDMFNKAQKDMDDHLSVVDKWEDFLSALDNKNIIMAPFCGDPDCEEKIKDLSKAGVEVEEGAPSMGAKSLCIPFQQPRQLEKGQGCVYPDCDCTANFYTLFGRSY